jgi:multidrug efflux pump subunit AcrA (membrane-fusion protein)
LIAVGQFATRGTPLIRLLDISRSEVSAQVSSRETPALQKAEALVFEHNGEHYPLRLRTILPTIHTETGTQEVRLDFVERKAEPGAAGRLQWRDKVMHIAAEFLVKRGEQLGVFTETAGAAHFYTLPDAQSGRPAAITLPPDTRIIVSGHYNLNDNAPVKVEANGQTAGKP